LPRKTRIESVFLNIPYDGAFEKLYLACIVGLTQLGLAINAALAVPNQGRLGTIVGLIEKSDMSIHDLSRVEVSNQGRARGVPRFNMPLERGLALYRSHITKGNHRVFVFERKRHRAQRSTSDVNGVDPQIHDGTIEGLMGALRNIFRQPKDVTTVPEMLASYRAVRQKVPELRRNAGSRSLFEAAIFQDLTLAALVESQKLLARRKTRGAVESPRTRQPLRWFENWSGKGQTSVALCAQRACGLSYPLAIERTKTDSSGSRAATARLWAVRRAHP
jgi:hypothetical protein